MCDLSNSGKLELVKELLEVEVDVNFVGNTGKTPLDLALCHRDVRMLLKDKGALTAEEQYKRKRQRDVLPPERSEEVRATVAEMLKQEPLQTGRMLGGLQDLRSGKFRDAAKGIEPFLGVRKSWVKAKECTVDGIVAEVKALCNCPGCAREQARVLKVMQREREAELTTRLAADLEDLQQAQEDEDEVALQVHLHKVDATRSELEACDGWVYGSTESSTVDWPEDEVKHQWGKYGQPLCDNCKTLCLDYSTIWADLDYILYQVTSELECFNGVRDRGRGAMTLDDFMQLQQVVEAQLSTAQLVALRFYTSHSFTAINRALRAHLMPHPLPALVMCISDGLKALRALDSESGQATSIIEFYRGFTDMQVTEEFRNKGGTEFAPMSTTTDVEVACGYAVRKGKTDGALLMKIVTENNLQRGADLTFLSMYPGEKEILYPPLTFMQPTGRQQVMEFELPNDAGSFKLCIIEVKTTVP